MCDVVFITPNMGGTIKEESLGTLQLATILKEKGIHVEILPMFRLADQGEFGNLVDAAMQEIHDRQPKIVSFYSRCDVYHINLHLAKCIKERWPEIFILFGGPQADITAVQTLQQIHWIDYVCCGEGETTIYPLVSSLLKGVPDLTIDGLVYRRDGQIVRNPRPELIEDLDSLPYLDYSLVYRQNEDNVSGRRINIDVGRGCPFACTFCSTKTFWGRKYRLKSPARICEEIKKIKEIFGISKINFSHDMFTANRKKVLETCQLIRQLDFPVDWSCSARLDCIDEELIDSMTQAGLHGVYLGIESGSPRMQKLINKNLKLDKAVSIAAYLKEKKVKCITSFIYGFPEETEEDISQTMALMAKLIELKTVTVQAHLCAFLVGTELTERYKDELTPAEVYSNMTGDFAVEECQDLIDRYPDLFQQMMEYKTPLRSKLRYFDLFWAVWRAVLPAYRYISGHYPEDRLFDMYCDFVKDNQQTLEKIQDWPMQDQLNQLLREDRLVNRFVQDENYDLLQDVYRMQQMYLSREDQTDIFCFEPSCLNSDLPLQEYPRCVVVVNWKNGKQSWNKYSIDVLDA